MGRAQIVVTATGVHTVIDFGPLGRIAFVPEPTVIFPLVPLGKRAADVLRRCPIPHVALIIHNIKGIRS